MQTKKTANNKKQAASKSKTQYTSPKATFVPITLDQRFKSCKGENVKKAIFAINTDCP